MVVLAALSPVRTAATEVAAARTALAEMTQQRDQLLALVVRKERPELEAGLLEWRSKLLARVQGGLDASEAPEGSRFASITEREIFVRISVAPRSAANA